VPLIIRWPDHLPAGQEVSAMVELVDILPTLLDLTRQPKPPDLHGRSLVPLLLGTSGATGRDVVVSEYTENEEAMARSERFKLIVGTGCRKRQDGYQDGHPLTGPYERLYDLQSDPEETIDLADRPELAATRDMLRHRLFERLTSTRAGLSRPPAGLSELQTIHWCLVPRDMPPS
jgi:arylsulfatase A-like enzyme